MDVCNKKSPQKTEKKLPQKKISAIFTRIMKILSIKKRGFTIKITENAI